MFRTIRCFSDVRVHEGAIICKAQQNQHNLSYYSRADGGGGGGGGG